jgi:hypothetical protein
MINIRETESRALKMKYHMVRYNEIGIVSRANWQKNVRPYIEYFEKKTVLLSSGLLNIETDRKLHCDFM